MKKFFLITFLAISSIANATMRTVSNSPSTLAQFNTIQAAVDASSSGDTVLIHGSSNDYAGFTISNKQLVVIGPGWAPNKNLPFTSRVGGCTITGAASSNTELQGIVFFAAVNLNSSKPDNMRFIRNHFTGGVGININQGSTTYTGYLFEGNFFENAQVGGTSNTTYTNFIFQNNWFLETGCCLGGNLSGFNNTTNVLFNHNLWSGSGSGSRTVTDNAARFLIFTNNIFVRRNAASNISSSTFSNNLTYTTTNNTPWASNSNVDGGNNIADTDPQMVASANVLAGNANALLDFSIAAGPANNAGTDGKDLGLLYDATGSLNWANSRSSRLPLIFSMNITNPTISSGGTLNVTVEARKSN
ncbi:MAG: hypothetical protein ACOYKE_09860 [Ferruginibacter sp.]